MEEARAVSGYWSSLGSLILFGYVFFVSKKWGRHGLQCLVSAISAAALGVSFWYHPNVWEHGISITMVFLAAAVLLFVDAVWKLAKEKLKAPE